MRSRHILAAVFLGFTACAMGKFFSSNRHSAMPLARPDLTGSSQVQGQPTLIQGKTATAYPPGLVTLEKLSEGAASPKEVGVKPKLGKTSQSTPQKKSIQDPDARVALSFVGADTDAEQYWATAINDPSLPAEERRDLIEDLNEDGLSDPEQPGTQDLPLIVNRLQIIEMLAPGAMDQVNAEAFAEAYKDLNNMLAGQPVD